MAKDPPARVSRTSRTEMSRTSRTKKRGEISLERTSDTEDTEGHTQDHVEGSQNQIAKGGKGTSESVVEFNAPPGLEPTLTDSMPVTFPLNDRKKIWAGCYVNLHGFLPQIEGATK